MSLFATSLRARITAVTLAALLAMIAIGITAGLIRERQFAAELGEVLRQDTAILWRSTVDDTSGRLARDAQHILADPAVMDALAGDDPGRLTAIIAPHLRRLDQDFARTRVEILDGNGQLAFNSGGELSWRPTLETGLVSDIMAGRTVDALRIDWGRSVVIVHGRRIPGLSRVLVVSAAVGPALEAMKADTDGEVFLLNRRGRLLAGTDPALWEAIARTEAGPTGAPFHEIAQDGRTLSVIRVGLDHAGGVAAHLVFVRDISIQAGQRRLLQTLALVLAGLATALVVAGLSVWLRRMFLPLERSVEAINALSAGDTSVSIPSPGRRDEIGRMARALDRFRANIATLARLTAAQERQRHRQETFIHREMTALAGTLDPLARETVLRDLNEIETSGSDRSGLGMMAAAFQKMSVRVRQQQQHLQELINDLREALKMQTAYLQLQQELDIAREIQKSMLPLHFPVDHPFIALHAAMEPAKEVGGDFYDFFFFDDRRLGVVIADVSGKGVPAALFMAISRTLLKATALFGSSPAQCLENLNTLLAENNEKELFVTVFYGILDMETGVFTYCNAGHNPPYRLHADGEVSPLPRTRGAALAIMAGLPQKDASVSLAPGESLFLFTDGVTEAQDASGALFGDDRLVSTLHKAAGTSPDALIAQVYGAVRTFVAEAPQFDDITCLAVRWCPTDRPPSLQHPMDTVFHLRDNRIIDTLAAPPRTKGETPP